VDRRELLSLALWSVLSSQAPALADGADPLQPPTARKRPKRVVQLGRVRVDDYAWLKDPQWKTVWRDPSVLQRRLGERPSLVSRWAPSEEKEHLH
jgi:oligopeptidase B